MGLIKALVRRDGLRVASSEPIHLLPKLAAVPLSTPLASELAPLLTLFEPLNGEITAADRRLERRGASDPVVARLATAPTVGPVTATAFVATLDEVTRFASAHQVEAYLGLTPGEHSSGDQQHRGRITKTGDTRARWLLVEAGWRLLRSTQPEAAALRAWGEQVARRRCRRIAAVALARRLAGILYAMWRDGTPFRAPAAATASGAEQVVGR